MTATIPTATNGTAQEGAVNNLPAIREAPPAIARYEVPSRHGVPESFAEKMELANVIADSGLVPDALRGKPQNVLVIMFASQGLNMPFFTALQELHVIRGKIGMSALMMRNRVEELQHRFDLLETSAERAVVQIHIHGEPKPRGKVTFTIQDAYKRGLVDRITDDGAAVARNDKNKPTQWETMTEEMLVARATSRAVRWYVPGAILGAAYTREELQSGEAYDDDTPPADAGPVPNPQAAADSALDQAAAQAPAADLTAESLLVEVADLKNADEIRAAWYKARKADLLNVLVGSGKERKPVRAHIEAAQHALKKGQPWAPPAEVFAAALPDDAPPADEDDVVEAVIVDDDPADVPAGEPQGEQEPAPAPGAGDGSADWPEPAQPGSGVPSDNAEGDHK